MLQVSLSSSYSNRSSVAFSGYYMFLGVILIRGLVNMPHFYILFECAAAFLFPPCIPCTKSCLLRLWVVKTVTVNRCLFRRQGPVRIPMTFLRSSLLSLIGLVFLWFVYFHSVLCFSSELMRSHVLILFATRVVVVSIPFWAICLQRRYPLSFNALYPMQGNFVFFLPVFFYLMNLIYLFSSLPYLL